MSHVEYFLSVFFRLIRDYSGRKFLIWPFSGDGDGELHADELVWSSFRGGNHSGGSFLGGSVLLLALASLLC